MQVKQEDKAQAQEKFVEIQQAYERLSDIKNRRARANKKSDKDTEQKSDTKTEL
jgi:curved DNA-binding protein CbpA